MSGHDRAAADPGHRGEPAAGRGEPGVDPDASGGAVSAFDPTVPSHPRPSTADGSEKQFIADGSEKRPVVDETEHRLIADGGKDAEQSPDEKRERPLSERSRRSLETEINDLEQNPEQYETRDQAVIDRYEGLLAERRRRQRKTEVDRGNELQQRLGRIKNQVLRAFRLR